MSIQMRPRFRMTVNTDVDDAVERLRATIAESGSPCYVDVYERQLEIRMRADRHHFWSPELNLIFRDDDDGVLMYGKFGPGAHVWTLFMAGYATFGMVALGGAILALSQMTIDEAPTGGFVVLAGAVGCLLVWVFAQVGQRLAGPQIATIRSLIMRTFPEATEN